MGQVFGTVRDEGRDPLNGYDVQVQSEDLTGQRSLLGSATTTSEGYSVQYDEAPTGCWRLVITVLDGNGFGVAKRTIVEPSENQRADFVLGAAEGAPPPLYAEVTRRVGAALGQASLSGLDAAGIARTSLCAGARPDHVAYAREAAVAEAGSGIAAPAFFALGLGRMPPRLADAVKHPSRERARAVAAAIAAGVLTEAQANAATDALGQLDGEQTASALQVPTQIASPGLAFELAGIDDPQSRTETLEAWRAWEGSAPDFWADSSLDSGDKEKLQFALQLASLTRGHVPLIQLLHDDAPFTKLQDLAQWEPSDWEGAIDDLGAPAYLSAAGLDGKYAEAMFGEIEAAFPTPMLSARSAWFTSGSGLSDFLQGNAAYDLASGVSFREFLRQNPGALTAAGGTAEQEAVQEELPILERLYRVSPPGARFETMRDLRAAGFVSATQINLLGREEFISQVQGTLGSETAASVFAKARGLGEAALGIQMQFGTGVPHPGLAVVPQLQEGRPDPASDSIGWQEMFGGRTFCSCEECQSAHGPAAYLADLLFWLKGRRGGAPAGESHLDELLRRRADIEKVKLSCKNAQTALPTIDLILELLEARLIASTSADRQTTLEEAELAARPEHVEAQAYRNLADPVVYPFDQPYVAWLDQARAFLSALGVEREVLLSTLNDASMSESLSRPEVAAEVLETTRTSWAFLAGGLSASTSQRWGTTTPADLAQVPLFLNQASDRAGEQPLAYAELEELLRSGYVQGAGELGIWFSNTVCDIAGASLVFGNDVPSLNGHLDRIAKLLRLQRILGWSVADLDRAIEVFRVSSGSGLPSESDISETLLLRLAALRWLERWVNQPPAELLDWYGPLDTRRWSERLIDGTPPGASGTGKGRVFQADTATAGDPDAELSPLQRRVGQLDSAALFAVSSDGQELVDVVNGASKSISAHLDAVASVVGTRPAELTPLLAELGSDPQITLANLSHLVRHVQLARSIDVDTAGLLRWKRWTGIDPFRDPLEAVRLLTEVREQATVSMSAGALRSLLDEPGERDLRRLAVPSVGEAMLALSEEARNNPAPTYLLDYGAATFSRSGEAALWDPRTGQFEGLQTTFRELGELDRTYVALGGSPVITTGVTDPFGGAGAATLEDPDPAAFAYVRDSAVTTVPAGPTRLTVYVKRDPAASSVLRMAVGDASGRMVYRVEPASGAAQIEGGQGTSPPVDASISTVEDIPGWWRVSMEQRVEGAARTVRLVDIYPAIATSLGEPNDVAAVGAVTIYPHTVEVGSAWLLADEPRRLSDGSVLIEGARENLIADSAFRQEGSPFWSLLGASLVESGIAAPDGSYTAVRVEDDGGSNERIETEWTASGTGAYVASVFIRKERQESYPELQLQAGSGATIAGGLVSVDIDRETGETLVRAGTAEVEVVDAGDWWRLSVSFQVSTAGPMLFRLYPALGTTLGTVDSSAVGAVTLWGAQVEFGSSASSPIRTDGTTVTRGGETLELADAESRALKEAPAFDVHLRPSWRSTAFEPSVVFDTTGDLALSLQAGGNVLLRDTASQTTTHPVGISWGPGDDLRIRVDHSSGRVNIANLTTGTQDTASSGSATAGWSADTNPLRIGDTTASSSPFFGVLERPTLASIDTVQDLTDADAEADRESALVRRAAALLDVEVRLLERLLRVPFAAGRLLRHALFAEIARVELARAADPEGSADLEAIEALVDSRVWEHVALLSWLTRTFDLRTDGLPWLLDGSVSPLRGFDLSSLVLGATESARYGTWAGFREAARLKTVAEEGELFDLLDRLAARSIDAATFRAELVERTRWSPENIAALVSDTWSGPLGGASASDWARPTQFRTLATVLELASESGADAGQLARWGALAWPSPGVAEPTDVYEAQAAELEQALRAIWGNERWLERMPDVREPLRERQRSALVSRLVGDPAFPYTSSDELGQDLLIDVQMGACARTSRIKDATRTVQSFIQRVQLGLEGSLRFTDAEARELVWRTRFRVWEANRKVFLYPENWIRPELRTDTTPLFEQLKNTLSQGALGEREVEQAFRAYLRDLAAVAKLEALTVYQEERSEGRDVFHVFARSRNLPHTYYHRTWVDRSRWTPWKEVPGVEGEHLVPIVFQRRLLLFWLNIAETAVEPSESTVPETNGKVFPPPKLFQIHLSWSEYRDGEWAPASRSEAFIGANQRGELSPAGLQTELLKVEEPIFLVEGWVRRTLARSVIHASARLDDAGRDLLIEVHRDALWTLQDLLGDSQFGLSVGQGFVARPDNPDLVALPRFRFSGIDSSVESESVDASTETTTFGPLPSTQGAPFRAKAQRFQGNSQLVMPFPFPDAAPLGPLAQTVLEAKVGFFSVDFPVLKVTPTGVARFDRRDPFVFDDEMGSYWVSPNPATRLWVSFEDHVGLEPQEHFDDILGLPPEQRERLGPALERFAEPSPALRNQSDDGPMAFLAEDALKDVMAGGAKVTSVHGQLSDRSASQYEVQSSYLISDAGGQTLDQVQSGSSEGADLQVRFNFEMKQPPISFQHPEEPTEGLHYLRGPAVSYYRFQSFSHPHVGRMRELLNRLGVFALFDPPAGDPLAGQDPSPEVLFETRYELGAVAQPYPQDGLDFAFDGAYSQYNWELFFHAPFLIAARLHEAGKFEEAREWMHAVFDPTQPTTDEDPRAFWRFRPFREQFADGANPPKNVQQLTALLTADGRDADAVQAAEQLLAQLADWRRNPFDPHAIARTRLIAYMAAVVMRYLEILLDWGDDLFAQDTMETVAEAAELYLLAARILGPRPEGIEVEDPDPPTFEALLQAFDGGVGVLERTEEVIEAWEVADDEVPGEASSLATLLYFCTPANPQLVGRFWDRVADRLFKIRNCLDLEGRRRELALFEPPIDPAALVRGAASGVDLRTLIREVTASTVPLRRYLAMAELAAGLAASTRSLGEAVLSAIQARDGDRLTALRAQHERVLQDDTIQAREDALAEADEQLAALRKNRESVVTRRDFYKDRPRTSPKEDQASSSAARALENQDYANIAAQIGTVLSLVPQFEAGSAGAGGSPVVKGGFGGQQLGAKANLAAQSFSAIAGRADRRSRMQLTEAGYDLRAEQWALQLELAEQELVAIDRRIAAAEIRRAIAENAVRTAQTRKTQLAEIRDVLERRFGNEALFDWMASELMGLHFQSYRLAYEFAKKAQRAFEYELGLSDSGFIQYGYWDSARKGLLAGERLGHDLRRMQVAYIEQGKRRLEVDQTFSLREIDPVALIRLQESGTTESFTLPEAFFDLYYPGQYRRRIRAVRVTVPAVVPPNANLPAMLTLNDHRIRATPDLGAALSTFGDPPVQMTATSSAQRDAGVFELDFRAPRLLPFEGAGALSDWTLSLPRVTGIRPFDYRQIQDVLLHVAYDAEYSEPLRTNLESGSPPTMQTNLLPTSPPRRRIISLRHEHGAAFRQLVQAGTGTAIDFTIGRETLPAYLRELSLEVTGAALLLRGTDATDAVLTLNARAVTGFTQWSELDADYAMPAADAGDAFASNALIDDHTIAATNWGSVDPTDERFDILLSVDLQLSPSP